MFAENAVMCLFWTRLKFTHDQNPHDSLIRKTLTDRG